jgi:WD40 repeat protein
LLYELTEHTDWVYAIRFSPDGELLATADRAGNLLLWQAANGRPVEPLDGHTGAIHALAYTYDSNLLASSGADGTVMIWDTWKYKRVRAIATQQGEVLDVAISRDGEMLTAGTDNRLRRWGLDGAARGDIRGFDDWSYRAGFTADGHHVFAGNWNGTISVLDPADGQARMRLTTAPEVGQTTEIAKR